MELSLRTGKQVLQEHLAQTRSEGQFPYRAHVLVQYLTYDEAHAAGLLATTAQPDDWRPFPLNTFFVEDMCEKAADALDNCANDFQKDPLRAALEAHLWVLGYGWEDLKSLKPSNLIDLGREPV